MNNSQFEQLLKKLDSKIESLSKTQTTSHSTEQLCSVGVINENMNIESLSQNQLILTHTMLHMFANSKNGKNVSKRTIEKLHADVAKKLKSHSRFDKLDDTYE